MRKLNKVSTLTTVALLLALAIICGFFFKIPVNSFVEIRFQFIPIAIGGMLYGPGIGALLGGLTDVLSYLVKPTGAFFPGFTLTAIVSGAIYGFFFYKRKLTLPRIALGTLVEAIICEGLLKSLCLVPLYGSPFMVVLTSRILKIVIMYFINVALLYAVSKAVKPISARLAD